MVRNDPRQFAIVPGHLVGDSNGSAGSLFFAFAGYACSSSSPR
jgi:hypothetical protein